MKETVNFLFVIDVSGSMYGQKIASVNASLTECLAELKQIGFSGRYGGHAPAGRETVHHYLPFPGRPDCKKCVPYF